MVSIVLLNKHKKFLENTLVQSNNHKNGVKLKKFVRNTLYLCRTKIVLSIIRKLYRKFPMCKILIKTKNFYDPNNIRHHSLRFIHEIKVITKGKHGEIVELYLNEHIDYNFYFNRVFDEVPFVIVQELGDPDEVLLVDIGANVGLVSLAIAIKGFNVIAVEPLSENLERLKTNFNLNSVKNYEMLEVAMVSEEIYSMNSKFLMGVPPGNSGASSLKEINNSGKLPNSIENVNVSTIDISLYQLIRPYQFKKLVLKIDTEGMEIEILNGGKELIREFKPVILMEYRSKHSYTDRYFNLVKFLDANAYSVHALKSVGSEIVKTHFDINGDYENILLIPNL